MDVHAGDASHRGLHHLGVIHISRVKAAIDVGNAKPVGYADDGAEIPRVLDAVEHQGEVLGVGCWMLGVG